jgi:hypothetical protein
MLKRVRIRNTAFGDYNIHLYISVGAAYVSVSYLVIVPVPVNRNMAITSAGYAWHKSLHFLGSVVDLDRKIVTDPDSKLL